MNELDSLIFNAECCKEGYCSECDYCGGDDCEKDLFNDIISALKEHKHSINKCKRCIFERSTKSEVQENA